MHVLYYIPKLRKNMIWDNFVVQKLLKHASDINTFGNKFTDAIRDKAGRDITYTISKNKKYKASGKCMNELYNVGTTEKGIVGCITKVENGTSISIYNESSRRYSTGKSLNKQQNRKSMISRFSYPMSGEESITNTTKNDNIFDLPISS
ncbi:hypothetical protein H8356DRAFT_1432053 [Neocallimastix lanati (nom. inval.)]|nr:hypothetical protein H8356DRAFT_1432053 [Neocallimastix sp. JGI-2020a]